MKITKIHLALIILLLGGSLLLGYRVGVGTKRIEAKDARTKHAITKPVSVKHVEASENPTVIGLTLDQSTLADVEKKYEIVSRTLGPQGSDIVIYRIQADKIPIDGLKQIEIFCSTKDNLVKVVMFNIDKNRFDYFYNELSKKYALVKSAIPFVGDKLVLFKQGDAYIKLDAPHMSFSMDLVYILQDTANQLRNQEAQERNEKNEQERNLL